MKKEIKKSFKEKFFIHGIANFIIFSVLIVFVCLTLSQSAKSVFGTNSTDPIYNGNKNSNKVSLMFNVYWGTEYLDSMLETLKNYDVKTTFFVGGQWVEKEPEYLTKIFNAGHEIGNHGFFHRDHDKLSYEQNKEEISTCHTMVKNNIALDMNLFAPPSGAFNKTTLQVANDLGYKTIMWSKDTIDWRDKDADLVYTRATKNVVGGDLILMHPTEHTAKALPNILEYYKNNNLVATTVSNTISSTN